MKVRLEVGPKEAEQGGCILAVCTTPGEVAAKTMLQVGIACHPCWHMPIRGSADKAAPPLSFDCVGSPVEGSTATQYAAPATASQC